MGKGSSGSGSNRRAFVRAVSAAPPSPEGHGYATVEYGEQTYRVHLSPDRSPVTEVWKEGRFDAEWVMVSEEQSIAVRLFVLDLWLESAGCLEWSP